MDAEVAFLMANQAQAMPGKLVYDPFVGTWSILVAAAHFGAMTMVNSSSIGLLLCLCGLSFSGDGGDDVDDGGGGGDGGGDGGAGDADGGGIDGDGVDGD
ncbi:hypothetical protein Tco_0718585 [Tanacetum coccineum]